ncbi:MAG: SPOR domain-containing protein [Candidatus Magnetominusculus sp. LBB02]|nr:SPOR domain-containing protein [Candidatus Magnetominusculus sp. LBB02]
MEGDNILVIDDDNNNTQIISEILREEGYSVYIAKTKAVALKAALEIHPVVVLVKAMLIDSSGYEVIRDLRNEESLKNLPFIMLSEIDKKYDDRYRTIYKIVDTVKLPIEKNDLLQKVRDHSEGAFHEDELSLDDDQQDDIKFDLIDKTEIIAEKPHYDSPAAGSHDPEFQEAVSFGYTVKTKKPEKPETPLTKDTDDYVDDEDLQELTGEDTTAIEPDEDELLNSLKESRAKRKKIFAIVAGVVFVAALGLIYMFFLRETKPAPSVMVAQKPIKRAAAPDRQPSPEPSPSVEPSPKAQPSPEKTPGQTPKPQPSLEPTPKAQSTPTKPTPAPIKPEPSAAPSAPPIAQTPKPEPTVPKQSKEVTPVEGKKQPAAVPAAEPEEKTAKAQPEKSTSTAHSKRATAAKKGKPLTAKRVGNSSGAYVIQLGSFKEAANAKRLTETLTRDGYNASTVAVQDPSGVTSYKVLAGRYKNRADAQAVANKLKRARHMDSIIRQP